MVPFRIRLPRTLVDKSLLDFFTRWRWVTNPPGEVILDLTRTHFLAPWAITLFALYGLWLREERGANLQMSLDPSTPAGRYAIQAGLPELFGIPSPNTLGPLPDARMAQPRRIRSATEIHPFVNSVVNLLKIGDEDLEGAVHYALVELLRNVVQHAGSKLGGISMAQYYPSTGLVEVVVADMGVGIKRTLQPRYPEITNDMWALKFAMLPHVSGTFRPAAYSAMNENAGLGLFFIKEIATRASGGFFLASGEMLADLWGNFDGSTGKKYQRALHGGWPGTFAVFQLRRDNIADFGELLAVCRKLAAEARRDSTELALDFVDEVPEMPGLTVVRVADFEENVEAAAEIRESVVLPKLTAGEMVVFDFSGIRFATQSFVHACIYKILRDKPQARFALSISGSSPATREAIRAVAAYAKIAGHGQA